jgi:hypothetical protein
MTRVWAPEARHAHRLHLSRQWRPLAPRLDCGLEEDDLTREVIVISILLSPVLGTRSPHAVPISVPTGMGCEGDSAAWRVVVAGNAVCGCCATTPVSDPPNHYVHVINVSFSLQSNCGAAIDDLNQTTGRERTTW